MKIILLLLLTPLFLMSVTAQSGRKTRTPPPPTPTETAVVESSAPRTKYQPETPAELLVLPQSFLSRQLRLVDSGDGVRLDDYDDKVIVINLWATWCGPCRMEIPDYEKVRKEYADRAVEFIALTPENPNTSADRVKKFVRSYNFGFRVGWADRETEAMIMNGSNAIPQTMVIAPGGRIVAHWGGYSPGQSGNRLRFAIEKALPK